MLRHSRCRLVLELSSRLGFVPSSAALRASFEPLEGGAARRTALVSPLAPCERTYGVVVPTALADDLKAISGSPRRVLVVVRLFLECEGQKGDFEHLSLWGREILTAALLVEQHELETSAAQRRSLSIKPSAEQPHADIDALLRSFWQSSAVRRINADAGQPQPRTADSMGAFVQTLPPRTAACGRMAANRTAQERNRAKNAYLSRRLAWQRQLATTTYACVRHAANRLGAPVRLVFVGDSHVRTTFAHVVALLGGNISAHCQNWHGDLFNEIGPSPTHLARVHFVWIDGIYANGEHGCRFRGLYSGRNDSFPQHLPPADVYFIGTAAHWESAYCDRPWQVVAERTPAYVRWVLEKARPGAKLIWLNANPRGGRISCPACGCRVDGGAGRSNARLLRLNALAWSLAAPYGFELFDAWPVYSDAFEDEAEGYDSIHFSWADCKSAGPRAYAMIGVLDAIRAHTALTRYACAVAVEQPTNNAVAEQQPDVSTKEGNDHADEFQLHFLPDADAVCLDGSRAALYYRAASREEHNASWIFFLEGGGFCLSEADCARRSQSGPYSSSLSFARKRSFAETPDGGQGLGGLFSTRAERSSLRPFSQFNQVVVKYCDGASYLGTRTRVHAADRNATASAGSTILQSVLSLLLRDFRLGGARHVLWTGCSAGGLGALLSAEAARRRLRVEGTSVELFAVASFAGLFFGESVPSSQAPSSFLPSPFEDQMRGAFEFSRMSLPQACRSSHARQHLWRCVLGVEPLLALPDDMPAFVEQSTLDEVSLPCVLAAGRAESFGGNCSYWTPCGGSDPTCKAARHDTIRAWQTSLTSKLRSWVSSDVARRAGHGCFVHSCLSHGPQDPVNWDSWRILNVSLHAALQRWWWRLLPGREGGAAESPPSIHVAAECRKRTSPLACAHEEQTCPAVKMWTYTPAVRNVFGLKP